TISIGAVKFPNSSKDYEKLISEADTALYRAKAKGRDCVVAYSEETESVL
ncbi:diguanylate cyclase, partial [candidate division KSB1 bacterium]|nr:diguanylate cyclase [candidate division KSB1 bacterium]